MRDEINNTPYQEKGKAGCLGIVVSLGFPLVGIILYFAQKDKVSNPKAYLYAAMATMIFGLLNCS